ncbi:MAG TPA: hypothetical protein VFN26_19880 [Candidatus Acidoferrum sp.]|nr:hypothetical protein [Candidatus Acidoferrum sp.]
MHSKWVKIAVISLFCAVVVSGLSYGVLVLTAIPAYAADCTPHCPTLDQYAIATCHFHGGLATFQCPLPGNNNYYFFRCNDGYQEEPFCAN